MLANNINRITLQGHIYNQPIKKDNEGFLGYHRINDSKYTLESILLQIINNKTLTINYNCEYVRYVGIDNKQQKEKLYTHTEIQNMEKVIRSNYNSNNLIYKDFLQYIPFTQSKIGVSNIIAGELHVGSRIDNNVRYSYEFHNINRKENKIENMIDSINLSIGLKYKIKGFGAAIPDYLNAHIPEIINQYNYVGNPPSVYLTETRIIKYTDNGYFGWHIDFKSDPTHLYNLIIYPPYSLCKPYSGGELVVMEGDQERAIDPKIFTTWTTIILDLDTKHRVNQTKYNPNVNNNNNLIDRIIIKCELHFSEQILKSKPETKAYNSAIKYKYPVARLKNGGDDSLPTNKLVVDDGRRSESTEVEQTGASTITDVSPGRRGFSNKDDKLETFLPKDEIDESIQPKFMIFDKAPTPDKYIQSAGTIHDVSPGRHGKPKNNYDKIIYNDNDKIIYSYKMNYDDKMNYQDYHIEPMDKSTQSESITYDVSPSRHEKLTNNKMQ